MLNECVLGLLVYRQCLVFLQVDCLSKEKGGLTEKLQESRSSLTLLLEEHRALQQQTNVGGGGRMDCDCQ